MTLKHGLAGLAMLSAASSHASDYVVFSNAPSKSHEIARGLLEAEAGTAIAADKVQIAELDLDSDGAPEIFAYGFAPFFCKELGCLPRIYRQTDGVWKNVLADDTGITRGSPANISIVGMTKNGFSDLLLGSVLLEWDGTAYREYAPPPQTQLDDAAFVSACNASPQIIAYVTEAGAIVKEPLRTFCDCLAGQFENAGLPQGELDLFTRQLAQKIPDAEIGSFVPSPQEYLYRVNDYKLSCRIELTVD